MTTVEQYIHDRLTNLTCYALRPCIEVNVHMSYWCSQCTWRTCTTCMYCIMCMCMLHVISTGRVSSKPPTGLPPTLQPGIHTFTYIYLHLHCNMYVHDFVYTCMYSTLYNMYMYICLINVPHCFVNRFTSCLFTCSSPVVKPTCTCCIAFAIELFPNYWAYIIVPFTTHCCTCSYAASWSSWRYTYCQTAPDRVSWREVTSV